MKNLILIPACLLLVACSASPEAILEGEDVHLPPKYEAFLGSFLEKTQGKDYSGAYALMSKEFMERETSEDFRLIIGRIGLDSISDKAWTKVKKELLGLLPSITGVFFTSDQRKHELTFHLVHQGEGFKIAEISEAIAAEELKKLLPNPREMKRMVKKDLGMLMRLLQSGDAQGIFDVLSVPGKGVTTPDEIEKLIRDFEAQPAYFSLPKDEAFEISSDSPQMNEDGSIQIVALYSKGISKIKVILTYDYEWEWKLGGFSFSSTPG